MKYLSCCDYDVTHRDEHDILDLQQPFLDGSASFTRRYDLAELHLLTFTAEHGMNIQPLVKLQLVDALKALLEMWLHASWVFGFRQYLQHFII